MDFEITDTDRINHLQRMKHTKWVGYDYPNGHTVWPVFEGGDIRKEIDRAIEGQRRVDAKD